MPLVRDRRAPWLAAALILLAVALSGSPAWAHTEFEWSDPADGTIVEGPLATITVGFTAEANPVGEEFAVRDASGTIRRPSTVTTTDDKAFVLTFDPPLTDGDIGVRWEVQAGDAHPIAGSFTFTVMIPGSGPAANPSPDSFVGQEPRSLDQAPTQAGVVPVDDFLTTDVASNGKTRRLAGRLLAYPALVGAVGGLAFVATTLVGSRRELNTALAAVRGMGFLVAVGSVMQYLGMVALDGDSFLTAWTSSPGAAPAVRAAGGLAMAFGTTPVPEPGERRWDPRTAPAALAGAALLVVSFWFDGHTVSEGHRVVHAAVNSVHVVAGSVWAGGVLAMAATVWSRSRRGVPTGAAGLVVRFSSIATVALLAVVAAGVVLTVIVLDSIGDLIGSDWGRILLLKTTAAAVAATLGGYNHVRLRPALEAAPDDPELVADLRRSLLIEAVALGFVVVATAVLVSAAT